MVTSPDARLDMEVGGFWSRGVTAFFDVRVTHVNFKCNQGKATSTIFKEQEEEKKRKYQQRVLDVEMGSFTPLCTGQFQNRPCPPGQTPGHLTFLKNFGQIPRYVAGETVKCPTRLSFKDGQIPHPPGMLKQL